MYIEGALKSKSHNIALKVTGWKAPDFCVQKNHTLKCDELSLV